MFVASFKNDDKDEINYIYVDENNKFIGLNINKDGIGNFDYESFNYFINNIKFSDKCFKIAKYNDYDVYFNPLTNYKHYIKDGKEDLLMFYLKNGNDALLYKKNEINKSIKDRVKSFILGSINFIIHAGIGVGLGFFILNNPIENIIDYKTYINDNGISYETVIYYDNISINDYINKIINGTNLTEEEKNLLTNKQLLMDITPYYLDTYMENLINLKLNKISIEFFTLGKNFNLNGFYNPLKPNVINISEDFKYSDDEGINNARKDILVHEFIHLLQSFSKYNYIKEGITEIIKKEYFNMPITS